MGLHDSFAELSRIVEQFEDRGQSVGNVEAVTDPGRPGTLSVTLDLPVAFGSDGGSDVSPLSATVSEAGTLEVEYEESLTETLRSVAPPDATVERRGARVTDDGTVVVRVGLALPSASSGAAETESTARLSSESPSTSGDTSSASDADSGGTSAADDGSASSSATDGSASRSNGPSPRESQSPSDGEDSQPDEKESRPDEKESRPDEKKSRPDEETSSALVRDESVPPYDDVPYLERLYESCDTFAEMSERIEMDVAAETVRRYMIDAGVHTPDQYDTDDSEDAGGSERHEDDGSTDESLSGGDESARPRAERDTEAAEPRDTEAAEPRDTEAAESRSERREDGPVESGTEPESPRTSAGATDPVATLPEDTLVTDGVGLPAETRVEDVVEAVVSASTVYEFGRELGIESQSAWTLLQQLNVLDLVLCRVSSERTVTEADVAVRIRESRPAGRGQQASG